MGRNSAREQARRVSSPQRVYYTPDQIREWRKLHGVSQSMFARLTLFSVETVKRWEKGTVPIDPRVAMLMQERRFRIEALAMAGVKVPRWGGHIRPFIPTRASPPQESPRD